MRYVYLFEDAWECDGVACCRTGSVLMAGLDVGSGHLWARTHGMVVVNPPPDERSTFVGTTEDEDGATHAVWTVPDEE